MESRILALVSVWKEVIFARKIRNLDLPEVTLKVQLVSMQAQHRRIDPYLTYNSEIFLEPRSLKF